MLRLSELFGRDIYTQSGDYKGKIHDIVVNLENGTLETLTTAPLKVRSKLEAKKIITEKSIPYKNVIAVKDIVIVGNKSSGRVEQVARETPKADVKSSSLVKFR